MSSQLSLTLCWAQVASWLSSAPRACSVTRPISSYLSAWGGAVFAAKSADGLFLCPTTPSGPLLSITDAQMMDLRSRTEGLADAH